MTPDNTSIPQAGELSLIARIRSDATAILTLQSQLKEALERAEARENQLLATRKMKNIQWRRAIDAEREVVKLRAALEPFVHYESWMDGHDDKADCPVHARITFGDLRRARAELKGDR